jgi:hypothetical protein
MAQFSDADWLEILELAGGLPVAALDEIKPLVGRYHTSEDKDFEVRAWVTKRDIKRAFALTEELSSVLGTLVQDNNYRCFNTGGNPVSVTALERVRDDLGALHSSLDQARVRFERKSTREWHLKRDKILVRTLLETQQRYLKTDLPESVRERPNGPRFTRYLEKCTGLSGPSLNGVLETVIDEFARRKTTR